VPHPTPRKTLLIGWDAADWKVINPLMDAGKMPNIQRLIENGGSILIIEHNLDVIRSADWVIDLGPEGGDRGGQIVAEGTPEQIAAAKNSYTGRYLRKNAANAAR